MNRKIAVIGAGYVGASTAYSLVLKGLAQEVVLIEQDDNKAKCIAEVNDIRHGISFMGSSNVYAGDYCDIKDCALIIVTAGRNRIAGESRLDLANDNIKIANNVANEIKKYYNSGIILVVTNPIDIITKKFTEWLNLPKGKIFGTGCLLDSSRLTSLIADYVGVRSEVVSANVIGEHGDGQIPLWSKVQIAGMPIEEYCSMSSLVYNSGVRIEMETKVINMGSSIIKEKQRTHYGIATCICYLADTILNCRTTIASVSGVISGEYGINDIALSLPSVINANGIERVLSYNISDFEYERLKKTAELIKDFMKTCS